MQYTTLKRSTAITALTSFLINTWHINRLALYGLLARSGMDYELMYGSPMEELQMAGHHIFNYLRIHQDPWHLRSLATTSPKWARKQGMVRESGRLKTVEGWLVPTEILVMFWQIWMIVCTYHQMIIHSSRNLKRLNLLPYLLLMTD